ncbi:DegV family protein [Corynebacterium aquatimens]|nr:DegV family protein [Corynebacterium aquatimens]WJY65339.1 DegV domain-containing protein [Corynebacterium aquatimens]
MAVRVVVDSSAGIPKKVARKLGITVLDLHMTHTEQSEDISTSGLNSLELAAAYARQLERGKDKGLVALHVGKRLSSTWTAAEAAAAVFDGKVHVVDTNTAGMAVGAAAIVAASFAKSGADLPTCVRVAEKTLAASETWLYVNQLEQMRKSGRLSKAASVISAALLATKPILHVKEGKLELATKTRTQAKAFAKLTDLVAERASGDPAFVVIQHSGEEKEASKELKAMLVDALSPDSRVIIRKLTPALVVHTGTGAIGVSAVFNDALELQDPPADAED